MKTAWPPLCGWAEVVNKEGNGLDYCLISDLNSAELKQLADLLAE